MAYHGVEKDGWSDEAIALLTKLYNDGFSASQTAKNLNKTLGTTYSRSAVTGKVYRLKLNREKGGGRSGKPRERVGAIAMRLSDVKAQVVEITEGVRGGFISESVWKVVNTPPFEALPGSSPRTLEERPFGGCHWPVGEKTGEGQLYCCQPVLGGHTTFAKLWCPTHHAQGTRTPRQTVMAEWTPEQRREHGMKVRAGWARKVA